MLFVFGKRGKVRRGDTVRTEVCPECGATSHTSFGLTRYVHLFWVPMFPYRRRVGIVCDACGLARDGKELQPRLRDELRGQHLGLGRALPYFSGIMVILLAGLLFHWDEDRTKRNHLALLADPQVGDLYEMNLAESERGAPDADYPYTLAKVVTREGTEVGIVFGKMVYESFMGTSSAVTNGEYTRDDYFWDEPVAVDLEDLKDWRVHGLIFDVMRADDR